MPILRRFARPFMFGISEGTTENTKCTEKMERKRKESGFGFFLRVLRVLRGKFLISDHVY